MQLARGLIDSERCKIPCSDLIVIEEQDSTPFLLFELSDELESALEFDKNLFPLVRGTMRCLATHT